MPICRALMHRVYPRAYGETIRPGLDFLFCRGLSPRIRGNHAVRVWAVCAAGSIPAHTGKPRLPTACVGFARVYPRAYGETGQEQAVRVHGVGLSPRIRGNR